MLARARALMLGGLTLCSALLSGCSVPGKPDPADRPIPADQVLKFSTLYAENCAGCHGPDGRHGAAPPLNDPLFRAIVPEATLKALLNHGRKGSLMPAFSALNGGSLTQAQIQVLVNEIKGTRYTLTTPAPESAEAPQVVQNASGPVPAWGAPATLATSAPAYVLPLSTANSGGDTSRGVTAFHRACAMCHGDAGEGTGKSPEETRLNDPVFLSLITNQALRRLIITGQPDFDMPGFNTRPGDPKFTPLSEQEVSDITALLASWRQIRTTGTGDR